MRAKIPFKLRERFPPLIKGLRRKFANFTGLNLFFNTDEESDLLFFLEHRIGFTRIRSSDCSDWAERWGYARCAGPTELGCGCVESKSARLRFRLQLQLWMLLTISKALLSFINEAEKHFCEAEKHFRTCMLLSFTCKRMFFEILKDGAEALINSSLAPYSGSVAVQVRRPRETGRPQTAALKPTVITRQRHRPTPNSIVGVSPPPCVAACVLHGNHKVSMRHRDPRSRTEPPQNRLPPHHHRFSPPENPTRLVPDRVPSPPSQGTVSFLHAAAIFFMYSVFVCTQ